MHPVKNRLAGVPGQASGNVVSTVNLSTGKQDAESAGEDGAVVGTRWKKKRRACVHTLGTG